MMTPEAKRRLKKEGKAVAERQSAALHAVLQRANPAPAGSDEWMRNHVRATANEKWLREQQPEFIPAAEVAKRFALVSAQELGRPEPWVECMQCHDVLYSYPKASLQCSCGSLTIKYAKPPRVDAREGQARAVGLIGKGTE